MENHRTVPERSSYSNVYRACVMDDRVHGAFGNSVIDQTDPEKRQYLHFMKVPKRRNYFIFSIEDIGQHPTVTGLL